MKNKKTCPRCLKDREIKDFKPQTGGNISYCYSCELAYYKSYNQKRYASPEARQAELDRGYKKYLEVVKPARMERKKTMIRLMGGKCQECGYSKSAAALDFDHIDPATKSRTVSHLLAKQAPEAWEAALEESKKCRLLCSNCHREKTYPGHEL